MISTYWIKIIYLRGARQLGGRSASALTTFRPSPAPLVDIRPITVTAQRNNFETAINLQHDLTYFRELCLNVFFVHDVEIARGMY